MPGLSSLVSVCLSAMRLTRAIVDPGRRVLGPIADGGRARSGRSVAGMTTPTLIEAVRRELLAHPEVTESTHRFGGIEFRLGRRELGHLHGEHLADLPFPRRV